MAELSEIPKESFNSLYKVLMTITEDNLNEANLNHFERDSFMIGLGKLKQLAQAQNLKIMKDRNNA